MNIPKEDESNLTNGNVQQSENISRELGLAEDVRAKQMLESESEGPAPDFVKYGEAEPIIDRDEVWVH